MNNMITEIMELTFEYQKEAEAEFKRNVKGKLLRHAENNGNYEYNGTKVTYVPPTTYYALKKEFTIDAVVIENPDKYEERIKKGYIKLG